MIIYLFFLIPQIISEATVQILHLLLHQLFFEVLAVNTDYLNLINDLLILQQQARSQRGYPQNSVD